MKVLANDGIGLEGRDILLSAGYEVITDKIEQADLPSRINEFDVLVVRSATKVNAEVLNAAKNIKLVVRAGVGIDNIDVKSAEANGIKVSNTPNSSSLSVAELAIAHMFSLARFLNESNREMATGAASKFKELKKRFEKGIELRGKTLGIIGFGRIGQETAKIAIGLGMKVIAHSRRQHTIELEFDHLPFSPVPKIEISTVPLEQIFRESDFISLHMPFKKGDQPVIGESEISMMKKNAGIINTARGGVIDEKVLAGALKSRKIAYAGVDVFENEPDVDDKLFELPNLSYSPHIGASTQEAQARVSVEVANLIIENFGKQNG